MSMAWKGDIKVFWAMIKIVSIVVDVGILVI